MADETIECEARGGPMDGQRLHVTRGVRWVEVPMSRGAIYRYRVTTDGDTPVLVPADG